ncbi:PhoP/Q-regulated protein PqaA [hydrothermal vent metagenome]|uniref:PhoP/Q-regulated protein PqaA n=1 Tax=hydrothermal vent metagenome TaxID=652676 RepID=A0A3B1C876_9ZZZZ
MLVLTCLILSCSQKQEPLSPQNALGRYLSNGDNSFSWELKGSFESGGQAVYLLEVVSQQWRKHLLKHSLTVIVPGEVENDGALFFITGGENDKDGPRVPGKDDKLLKKLTGIAAQNKAVVSIIRQVPNQPMYDGLTEDALISFTLHHFQEDSDYTWPLLFPMVKSAIRGMDAVQEFSKKQLSLDVEHFVVSGASKRGWTTWLTGANDKRVVAIAPMVIDVLNMPVNIDYQINWWGDYSIQIEDYVKLGIAQQVSSGKGHSLVQMIDPYSYRGELSMPKMIFIGTNDEYWPVDAIKNYIDSIPGEDYIHYTPNAGHDLGGGAGAFNTLSSFFGFTLRGKGYPKCGYRITQAGGRAILHIETSKSRLLDVVLCSATSDDRDFRDEKWGCTPLGISGETNVEVEVGLPESGYKAFYVDLVYENLAGVPYTESTRMYTSEGKILLLNRGQFQAN